MNRFSLNGLFAITEWITKLAYLNLLWLGFSLVGLGIFGFFPATVSMFTVARRWLFGETDIPIFPTYWKTYKKEFFKSNGLGLIILILCGLIVLDLVFMNKNGAWFTNLFQIPIYLFIFSCAMTMLYLFPVYVHYELKFIDIFKNSLLIMLINPISNLVIISGVITIYLVMKFIPGLAFFFGGSVTAMIIMAACNVAFNRVEQKKHITKTP